MTQEKNSPWKETSNQLEEMTFNSLWQTFVELCGPEWV